MTERGRRPFGVTLAMGDSDGSEVADRQGPHRAPRSARGGLAEAVASDLLDLIASSEFPPGSQLPPEGLLAERAEVSRLTLREAIKRLVAKRVLHVVHGRGTFVRPSSEWSILEPDVLRAFAREGSRGPGLLLQLLEARRIVEVGVAEIAAGRRTKADLADMETALADAHKAEAAKDIEAFVRADIGFHVAVMRAAHNEIVVAFFRPIEGLVLEGRRATSRSLTGRQRALSRHAAVLEAIRSGDPAAARAAMDAHLGDGLNAQLTQRYELLTGTSGDGGARSSVARRRRKGP